MKLKVKSVFFIEPLTAPGAFGSEISLSEDRYKGVEMYTGEEPGMLVIHYRNQKIGTSIHNCRSLIWEEEKKC